MATVLAKAKDLFAKPSSTQTEKGSRALSNRDRDEFLEILRCEPDSNARTRKAVEQYKKLVIK